VDTTRAFLWVLLPVSLLAALFFVSQGMIQNLRPYTTVSLMEPQVIETKNADGTTKKDSVTTQVIAQGPVASQEAIKMYGTNGGGFFGANSAHPFENPTPLTNFVQMLLIFAIPSGLTYTLGRMTGSQRHGWAVWSAMAAVFLAGVAVVYASEARGNPLLRTSMRKRVKPSPAETWKERRYGLGSRIQRCSPP
jgi:K+-transporting ATPase ATPase A chain